MSRFASSEERVSAWLDRMMTPEELDAFASDLEQDEALATLAERLAAQDRLVGAAFPLDERAAQDPAFLERMGLAPISAEVINLANAREQRAAVTRPTRRYWPAAIGGAIAASLAVVTLFGPGGSTDLSNTPAFAAALDATPSRDSARLTDNAQLTPVLSFASADGRYCREFALTEDAKARSGIACKGNTGWRVEAWGGATGSLPDGDSIVAADGTIDPALDKAYERLGASDPISAQAEAALIRSKWTDIGK